MTTETKKDVSVKKIVVQLGKKELILDIEDAKELKKVLVELFGEVIADRAPSTLAPIVIEKHIYEHRPFYYQYNTPFYGTLQGTYKYDNNVVYCSTNNTGVSAQLTGSVVNAPDIGNVALEAK